MGIVFDDEVVLLDHARLFGVELSSTIVNFLREIHDRRRQPFSVWSQFDLEFRREGDEGEEIIYVPMRQEGIFIPVRESIQQSVSKIISQVLEKISLFVENKGN